jgi:uncharacterized protein YoxC
MDSTIQNLVIIQTIGLALVLIALVVIAVFLMKLVNKLIWMIDSMKAQIDGIDGEMKPIMRDVQKMLSDMEPLVKEVGQHGQQIGSILENLERVSDDVSVTTGAIRTGVVPIAHSLAGIFAGIVEGGRAFGEYSRRRREIE